MAERQAIDRLKLFQLVILFLVTGELVGVGSFGQVFGGVLVKSGKL